MCTPDKHTKSLLIEQKNMVSMESVSFALLGRPSTRLCSMAVFIYTTLRKTSPCGPQIYAQGHFHDGTGLGKGKVPAKGNEHSVYTTYSLQVTEANPS